MGTIKDVSRDGLVIWHRVLLLSVGRRLHAKYNVPLLSPMCVKFCHWSQAASIVAYEKANNYAVCCVIISGGHLANLRPKIG